MIAHRLRTTLVLALVAATASFGLDGLLGGLSRESRAAGMSIGSPDRSLPEGSHEDDSGTLVEAEEEVEANDEDGERERLVGTTILPAPRPVVDPRAGSADAWTGMARLGHGRGEGCPRGPPGRG